MAAVNTFISNYIYDYQTEVIPRTSIKTYTLAGSIGRIQLVYIHNINLNSEECTIKMHSITFEAIGSVTNLVTTEEDGNKIRLSIRENSLCAFVQSNYVDLHCYLLMHQKVVNSLEGRKVKLEISNEQQTERVVCVKEVRAYGDIQEIGVSRLCDSLIHILSGLLIHEKTKGNPEKGLPVEILETEQPKLLYKVSHNKIPAADGEYVGFCEQLRVMETTITTHSISSSEILMQFFSLTIKSHRRERKEIYLKPFDFSLDEENYNILYGLASSRIDERIANGRIAILHTDLRENRLTLYLPSSLFPSKTLITMILFGKVNPVDLLTEKVVVKGINMQGMKSEATQVLESWEENMHARFSLINQKGIGKGVAFPAEKDGKKDKGKAKCVPHSQEQGGSSSSQGGVKQAEEKQMASNAPPVSIYKQLPIAGTAITTIGEEGDWGSIQAVVAIQENDNQITIHPLSDKVDDYTVFKFLISGKYNQTIKKITIGLLVQRFDVLKKIYLIVKKAFYELFSNNSPIEINLMVGQELKPLFGVSSVRYYETAQFEPFALMLRAWIRSISEKLKVYIKENVSVETAEKLQLVEEISKEKTARELYSREEEEAFFKTKGIANDNLHIALADNLSVPGTPFNTLSLHSTDGTIIYLFFLNVIYHKGTHIIEFSPIEDSLTMRSHKIITGTTLFKRIFYGMFGTLRRKEGSEVFDVNFSRVLRKDSEGQPFQCKLFFKPFSPQEEATEIRYGHYFFSENFIKDNRVLFESWEERMKVKFALFEQPLNKEEKAVVKHHSIGEDKAKETPPSQESGGSSRSQDGARRIEEKPICLSNRRRRTQFDSLEMKMGGNLALFEETLDRKKGKAKGTPSSQESGESSRGQGGTRRMEEKPICLSDRSSHRTQPHRAEPQRNNCVLS